LNGNMTPPEMSRFSDEGFGDAAFPFPDGTFCDVVLTISAKGKPSDPSVTRCEKAILEKPAVASLLKSQYKPGRVNGKRVAVRTSIHLEFDGFDVVK
jgi:hypothetical protein